MAKKKIKLTDTTSYSPPETFEEWIAIHGEPEYIGENNSLYTKDILIEDCEETFAEVDTSGILTCDSKGNMQLNYKKFVDVFATVNNCVYCNGVFYNPDGVISNQSIRKDIATSLGNAGWEGKLDAPTTSIFNTLKDLYSVDELPINEKVIPLANGDLHIGKDKWVFRLLSYVKNI